MTLNFKKFWWHLAYSVNSENLKSISERSLRYIRTMCQNLMIFQMIVRSSKSLEEGNLGANELYKLSSSAEVALMPQLTGAFLLILKYGCHLNADKIQGRTSVAFEAFLYSFCEIRDFFTASNSFISLMDYSDILNSRITVSFSPLKNCSYAVDSPWLFKLGIFLEGLGMWNSWDGERIKCWSSIL